MSRKADTRLSALTLAQRQHLAWLLDHRTGCGYLTACSVAQLEQGDFTLYEVFTRYGDRSHASAVQLAGRVLRFAGAPWVRLGVEGPTAKQGA